MDIIKAFKLNEQEIKVNIQGTQDEPLFQANQIGKILDIKKIRNTIQNFNEDEKCAHSMGTPGGEQKCLFLTEKGLYRLLGQSRKPIAKTFQGWMVNVIQEIRINGIYQLKQENEVDRQLLQKKHKKDIHNILIEKNQYKNVVYIVQFEDETYEKENKILIKIGNTQSIKERIQHLQCDFNKNINLIDIYECINHVKFERFLHNNEYIKNFNHKMKTIKDIDSKEIYLINTDVLKDFKNIIQENIEKFNDSSLINRDTHLKLQEKELVLIEKEMEIQKAQQEYNLGIFTFIKI